MKGIPNKPEDVWKFVDKNGPTPLNRPELGPCWMWVGAINSHGYGTFRLKGKSVPATRLIVGLTAGTPIPAGYEPDHLCRNRACVNPQHCEIVTRKINQLRGFSPAALNARKTHCVYGHPLSADNLMIVQRGTGRRCRLCHRKQTREAATRLRERRRISLGFPVNR